MFRGSIVALATPMLNDEVDVPRLRELVEFHIQAGTHALVAAGTTGEAGTLSNNEKMLVIKTVVEQAKERIPVIAGTALNATKDCIALTKEAMECGAHAALIRTPSSIKPTQEGLYLHYSAIAQAVGIPIILYNVPSRTGCDLLPETVGRLAKISNIIGVKEAIGQRERFDALVLACEGTMDIYAGDDFAAAEWMLAGAKGVVSVTANVAARMMSQLCDAALDKEAAACLAINEQLNPLHELMFVETNPIPVKWALSKMGLMANEIRLPLTTLSDEYHQPLEQVLRSLQLV
ncbi:MAG: 4-hydroxy-tetrahydrodipicolinate synthase [Tatlockia sp.]|jgi:4-hydroxy-tetrahydrodipicolinate synthase